MAMTAEEVPPTLHSLTHDLVTSSVSFHASFPEGGTIQGNLVNVPKSTDAADAVTKALAAVAEII